VAGRISTKDIDEVKARTNIADIIGGYVALKPSSQGSLKGLCPFHQEKSPSFNVRPLQGFYHCFGCGAGGDVYKFLQELESLSFYEAVEMLAGKIGYQLNYEAGAGNPDHGLRARVFEANAQAAKYFQEQLATEAARIGREFLASRGFDKSAAEVFSVGFAPKAWSSLTDHLRALGFTEEELLLASLASRGERGLFDKFRGRLIWPIRDSSNQVLGFGARKLFDDDKGPKYLNTSETPVYHKSAVLYGIDLAKKEISRQQRAVIVEGYTDVMACHLAGITTAVATCGTAFGDEHIRVLNRLLAANIDNPAEVVFTFDPDEAGQKAAMRAYEDSDKFNANSFIAIGPGGLDPCDLRLKQGDQALLQMIEQKRPIHEFAIRRKLQNFDLATVEGRVGAAKSAASVIARIRDNATRSVYTRELANWVSLDVGEVLDLVERARREKVVESVKPLRTGEETRESTPPVADLPDYKDPIQLFEKQLLEVLIQHPGSISDSDFEELTSGHFLASAHRIIAQTLHSLASRRLDSGWLADVSRSISDQLHPLLRSLAATELPASNEDELSRYIDGVVVSGFINSLNRQKLSLQAVLRQLDPSEKEKAIEIQKELVSIEAKRRGLQGG
jgi:DNA primase